MQVDVAGGQHAGDRAATGEHELAVNDLYEPPALTLKDCTGAILEGVAPHQVPHPPMVGPGRQSLAGLLGHAARPAAQVECAGRIASKRQVQVVTKHLRSMISDGRRKPR